MLLLITVTTICLQNYQQKDEIMEKGIEVVARYHYQQGYFVEVTTEKSVLAGSDYWLWKKNSPRKVFMFSSKFKNEDQEVHQIIDQIKNNVEKYEHTNA